MTSPGALEISTPTDREIVLRRVCDAPRRRVFEAMISPELVRQWLSGPPGWELEACEIDPRPGGAYNCIWREDDATEMRMHGVYQEVSPPERIVRTEKFEPPWYPGGAVGTLELDERDGRTTLTLTMRYDSRAARDGALTAPVAQSIAAGYDRLAGLLRE